ncbi:MAG: Asp-tRNA(Asn)/Glu-tRNA(Gln) amidotransferase subunit GatA [Patescibacteria group bacterium]
MENKDLNIKKISELYAAGKLKSVEVVQSYLEKISSTNQELNAFIKVLGDDALKMAEESQKRFESKSQKGLLDGIPIAIKDNIAIEGIETTAASKILEGFIPPYEATVIKKLKAAGAVILGKTNMDEFAMGSSTENSVFGPTKNPSDKDRVPGGSSGGSAAAVAADMAPLALGSDTGGSIRQPASFTGIVGFKPTYGTVSRYGLFAMASSLDQIGPMAKTVEDAEILYDVIRGHDVKDSTSLKEEIKKEKINLKDLKIGIPKEYFAEGLDPEVKKVIERAIEKFKEIGAQIKEVSLPNSKYALSCYYIIMPVEVASNLARYDGIKYGFSAQKQSSKLTAQNLLDIYLETRSNGFGKEVKRRVMLGTYTSSSGYIDQYYNKAQKVRALIKKDFDKVFEEVDFILGPVSPETAFKIGQKSDPLTMYLSDIYTIAVNLAGLPAISIPCGKVNSLPVGLQIIGPQLSDFRVLGLAKIYEGVRDGLQGA